MKPSRVNTCTWIIISLLAILYPPFAMADGGLVQLREAQGSFLVTVFVSPEIADGDATDVSVLVQSRENGEVVLDANVDLIVEPPAGLSINESDPLCGLSPTAVASRASPTRHSLTVRATRDQASNKLLYAALLKLKAAGDWRLHVFVSEGADSAGFDCLLPVARTSAGLQGFWPYLILPPIVIIAFAINQCLRKRSLETAFPARSIVRA